MVVIEWPSKFNDDIDLWVKSPDGKTVSFVKKEAGIMNLEKDDLGVANDSTVDEYGQRKVIYINREVITIRGILAGQYQVAAHVYSMRPKNGSNAEIPQVIKFKLIKINPYKEHIILEKFYNVRGQVITLANFWVDKNGKFVKYNTIENNIVTRRNNGGGL
jgi:hypothetical protein